LTRAAGPSYPQPVERTGPSTRVWEIDFLRGLAVILMIGYHLLFDLGEFHGLKRLLGFSTDLSTVAWTVAEHFFAGLFVVLSGISSTLSRNNLRRGLKLLLVSLVVTAATYAFDSSSAVYFGILQCLAISMLVYGAAFEKAGPAACAAWGALVIGFGILLRTVMKGVIVPFDWLMPFGITSPSFGSFDYFPLFPWFGIFLVGSALGKSVYAARRSRLPWRLPGTIVNWAGRHALLIYIVHQPIIMGVLYLLGFMR
jgi:uncharacterized membrane protein